MTDIPNRIIEARAVGAKAIAVEIDVIERLIAERDARAENEQRALVRAAENRHRAEDAEAEVARLRSLVETLVSQPPEVWQAGIRADERAKVGAEVARLREAMDWIRTYAPETVIAAEVKFAFNPSTEDTP